MVDSRTVLRLRCSIELRKKLEAIAKRQRRRLSDVIRIALEDYIAAEEDPNIGSSLQSQMDDLRCELQSATGDERKKSIWTQIESLAKRINRLTHRNEYSPRDYSQERSTPYSLNDE